MAHFVTFYSWKGGVGRTVALANAAIQLARRGRSVLVVDWDLEAPGLDRYLTGPLKDGREKLLSVEPAKNPTGLLGLLTEFLPDARKEVGADRKLCELDWQMRLTKISVPPAPKSYSNPNPPTPGQLHLLASGHGHPDYSTQLSAFSWEAFYSKGRGHEWLERLRDEWMIYDLVLIDSRTGLTDSGAICTIHFADSLVLVFTTNEQSFVGGMQFVDAAQQARRNYPTDRAPLVVIPVLSRWDGDREVDIAEQWMARLDQELRPLTDAWLPRHFSPRQYLEKARVRHVARFSFGEPLPVLTHSLTDPTLPCVAYEILARMIDSNCADAGDVVDETYSVKESTLRNIISSDDELELKRFRAHFERSNRRTRFVWAMSLALLMITFGGSYVWDFCTFTAVVAETLHENQRTEIVVTRKWDPRTQSNRFRLGTFVFRDEMRNQDAIIKFHQGVKLNVGFQPDWTALVPLLNDSRLGLAEIEWLSRPITSPRSFIKEDEDAVFQFNDRWKWGRADSKVIDALVMLLKDQESDVRGFATDSLWRLGKSDPEKIASLLTLLKDQNRGVRSRAAESLGKLGKGDPSVIVPLVTLLNDSDGVVRSSAAKSLGQLGNSNPVVIDSLVTLFIDSDSVVRSSAAKSLGQLGDSAPAVIDALVTLLKDLDSDVRYRAVESLGQLRKSDAKVIAALVTLLEDQNNDDYISYNAKGQPTTVRSRAAMSLGQLGKSDPVVIDALVTLLKDQNVFIRSNAAESLGQLGMSTPSVIDALVPLLEDPDRDVRFSAAASLVQLGKSDSPVIAALLPVLNDPSFYYDETRARAEATLVQLGKNDRMVSDVFVRLLNDPNRAVRSLAAASLVQMGKSAPALIEILVALLEDQESNIRSRAAASLGQLEKSAPAVIVALTTLLKDQDRYVSRSAAKSLGQIAKTRDDWTDLRMLAELSNFDSGIRERAGIVLAYRHDEQGHELNPQTRQAIEQLRKDPRPWVRQASLHALYHIENRKAELAELARNNGVTANTTPK